MPTFVYEGLNAAGKPQKGTVEAPSREEAIERIKERGCFPTAICEQKAQGAAQGVPRRADGND